MKKTGLSLVAAILVAGLGLAGCSNSSAPSGDKNGKAAAGTKSTKVVDSATGMPTIAGDKDGMPTLNWPSKTAPTALTRNIVKKGDGKAITPDDVVTVNYVGYVWGKDTPFDSSWQRKQEATFGLNQVISGWKVGLSGAHVGDRVILSVPAKDGYGEAGVPQLGITGKDTLVFVVDLIKSKTLETNASGQADATPTGAKLPVEITGAIGKPVTALKVAAGYKSPEKNKLTIIAKGTGPALDAKTQTGKTLGLQIASIQADGKGFQTSWGHGGVALLPVSDTGVVHELMGVPVGSRVLLELPAPAAKPGSDAPTTGVVAVLDLVSLN